MKKFSFNDKEKVFYIADLHLGHNNIIKHCNRPFKDYKEMDEVLINNWNNVVGENDTVFCCWGFFL